MLKVSFLAFSDHDLEDERHSNDIIHVEAAAGTPMSSAQRYGLRLGYSLVKNPEQVLNVSNYSQHPQVRMQKVTQLSNHQSSNHLSYIEYHMSSHILFSCGVMSIHLFPVIIYSIFQTKYASSRCVWYLHHLGLAGSCESHCHEIGL